ncbi:hypothetical protein D8B22_18495, partial [Verminephrobacter aporrectodeae subsp. tuberculatae]|uniref:SwmB domain-containing protein n=1 Tax=Verminephrobacter aporrectodeae TaxID=1110389 RepID=UPI0022448EE0
TRPASGNGVLQDAAGNDAANLTNQAVTNSSAADTTAPVFSTATVSGRDLVLAYTEVSSLGLDATHTPPSTAFAVSSASGIAIAVESVAINATAKTVTLHLSRDVDSGEAVSLRYTRPASGNVLQDAAGNDAANLADQVVTNNSATDTTAPVLGSATVSGRDLVLTYTESSSLGLDATNTAPATAFAVSSASGVAIAVDKVTVNATAKTITLRLSRDVDSSEAVSLSYTRPATGNDVLQDAAGNDVANLTSEAVTNSSAADTTAPVLGSATVSGHDLVLTYTEASSLGLDAVHTAPAAAFAVSSASGLAISVESVAVDATAKTVTLHLSRAVDSGEVVSLNYTKPATGNDVLQDAAGNDAENLTNRAAVNQSAADTTAPVLGTATVNGRDLVLTYTEASSLGLDAAHTPPSTAFAVSSASGVAIAVENVAINATAKTVTLHLSRDVDSTEVVSLGYTRPATGNDVLQDVAGNDAANLTDQAVTNNSGADTTAPVLNSATVSERNLVLTYTEASSLGLDAVHTAPATAYAVSSASGVAIAVNSVMVDATAKTVTLLLSRSVDSVEAVSLNYTRPATGNDVLQDAAGNDAANLTNQAVTNNSAADTTAPVLSAAVVNGHFLALSYTEASSLGLDETNTAPTTAFAVNSASGLAIAVNSVTVNALARTVTLHLSRDVDGGEAITLSYTKPATGNKVLQDAAGNDAANLTNEVVRNNSAADTTAPVLGSATVSGRDLVLTYTEVSSLGLDAVNTAPATAFAVSSASGVAITVENVTVHATAKTVTLHLSRDVDSTEAVSLSYTRPAGDNVLQDVAGNDAANLTDQAVTNHSGADTTAPVLSSATVSDRNLVLTYTEASSLGLDAINTAPAAAFAVSSASGLAIAVDSVAVDATAKTVTLRLSRSVDSTEVVTLSYTRPASGNDVLQDAAGNDAANLTSQAVTNNSAADTTAPVLSTATVTGNDLVLTYTEASSLGLDAINTAPATAFALSSASGVAITVDSLTVDPTAKTVTLHLSRAVDSGEAVTLNYIRPETGNHALQDAAGNDAANRTNQAITNNSAADTTAPVLGSATVSGRELVLTYTEASSLGLDAVNTAPATAFAVSSASGVAITVENVTVHATAKTVTLHLSRDVDSTEAVSLSYTRPAGDNVLQDAAGNDAANLTDQAVTNNSGADTTAPVLSSATVSDRNLVLTYTEASSLGLDAINTAPAAAFAVSSASGLAIAVENVAVDATAKTVTLRLSRSVDSGEVVSLNYTRPASGNDVLQDAAGNDAANLTSQAVTNNSAADTTAPVLSTATVSGRNLVLTYTEASSLGLDAINTAPATAFALSSASGVAITVDSLTVDPTAKTVTLHLSRAVDSGEAVTLNYIRPETGNHVLQDAAGNDTANLTNQAVTNNSAADTTAPVLGSATVSGRDLVLTYTEASSLGLDAIHTAPATAYVVSSASGVAITVENVTVNATAKTVTLHLSRDVDSTEVLSLNYTRPATGNDVLQDAAGNDAANLTNQAVTNGSAADTTAPVLGSATVNGHDLVLTYTEASSLGLDAVHTAPAAAFAVSSASGVAIAVDSVAVDATAKTVTLRLSRSVDSGEAVALSYTRPATGNDVLQDAAGNGAENLINRAVTNNSAADTTAPVLSTATVSGHDLVLTYTEASSLGLDATNTAPATAFAVSSASGVAITVDSLTVDPRAKTVTLLLSRAVDSGEAVTLNYTRPATGNNVLQDAAGNDAANLTNQAVSNGSAADTTAPVLGSATVSGRDLVLTYTETSSLGLDAINTAPAVAYAVSSASGVAITVENAAVNATAKTVTLLLSRDVDSTEVLSLNYTRPAAGPDVLQDAAGNGAANLTNQAVSNGSAADTTAPVLGSATVNGNDLVLTYTEASSLGLDAINTAPAAAFAVSSASGLAITVESVTVHATAKTVTLRLSRAVDSGEAVTLNYTRPATGNNVLQDAAGNDAANLTNQAVTNSSAADTTAPVLGSATVSGRELVLTYTEVSSLGLDAIHTPPATAYAVSSASGVAIVVENVTVHATAKTVTLHLSRDVDSTEAISLGYTRPETGNDVLQDAAGNDAANLTNQAVSNSSAADTTAPVFGSAAVSGRNLVLTYTEASSLGLDAVHTAPTTAFAVSSVSGLAITVESVTVNATAKTVTLLLNRGVDSGEAVSLSYTKPATGNDVLQDAAGNDAENLTNRAVTNNSAADTTAPVLSSATVTGNDLVLSYTEASSLGLDATNTAPATAYAVSSASGVAIAVDSAAVNATAKTVTLRLNRAVDSGEAVTLNYTRPATGNKVLQDAAGNDADNLTNQVVTNHSAADTTAPVLSTATVSGRDLVLSYTEASSLGLDAANPVGAAAFAVSSASGVAITVESVTVGATAKTVTLHLSRDVDSTEAVSMSYTRPATGNVLQDVAGNDADSLTSQAVTNNSGADTTVPVLSSATVSERNLVLTYTEASSLGLDAVHTAPATAYAVSSASGVAIAVNSVMVDATAKTVTLLLSRSVDSVEAVSVSYTRPATGNDVLQDAAGNDAANLTNQAVTNNSAADTTAPVLSAAVVNGHFLALSYTEASSLGLDETNTAPTTAFAVNSASGLAIAVNSVTVNALARTVTLHLSRDVDSGEAITLSYTKPATGNKVLQDAAGNDAANLTNEVVRNNSATDTTAPVLGSATVSGRELVLTYTEVSSLGLDATHTPPSTAFAVSSASGVAITVENVTVHATAKTVTLHLSRDVDSTEVLSLGYTRPATGNVLQDAAGNDAANLTNQAVSNGSAADTTAPVLGSATVSGHDLVLTYTEASSLGLDAVHMAPAAAFAVSSASGLAIAVDSVAVDATAKTVTLRLSRSVDSGEVVTLNYTKPATGNDVLQDAAGNDAANLTNQSVTNNSAADTTAPVLSTATLSGRDLVLTYTEASSLGLDAINTAPATAFAVSSASGVAITVDNVTVNATAKTVTLLLSRAVDSGEVVTLNYIRPETGNHVLQDAAGNDAANLTSQAVTNNSAADTTVPVLGNATVSGRDLVLTYTETSSLGLDAIHTAPATAYAVSSASGVAITVENVTVNATAKTVTLLLSRDVDSTEVVSLNYTRPASGNDVLQDAAGNGAANLTNQTVSNGSAADTTAPVLGSATVSGHDLVLTYTEASSLGLDAINTAPAAAFAVSSASGVAITVESVTVSATAKTVTLHLNRAVDSGEAVTLNYTRPATGNDVLQDAAGNDAANLTAQAVTNNSAADTTAPVFGSATVSGRNLVLTYTEASSLGLDATHTAPATAYAVSSASGVAISVENVTVNATAKTVTLHLSRDVDSTEVLSLNYTRPETGNDVLQDAAGNDAANLTNQVVTNGSAADTTAPVLSSAAVSGRNLVLTYTEASSLGLDAAHTAPTTAFAVNSASGLAITVENVTVNATAKTMTLLLNRDVDSTEVVSLGYTRPATGNDVLQDAAGNDAANLTNQAVTNGSAADTTAPVLSSATVTGNDLVLTYTEASSLGLDATNTAPAAAFAVSSTSGVAITVERVTVNATAKTVTLRLNRAVDSGEALSLNYTRPATGNDVLQDAAGNDAANLTNQAVTNGSAADTTAPVLGSATVSGRDLVLSYTEASSLGLDAANPVGAAAFAVSSASGVAISVESVTVGATAKTVTLHLSRDVDSTEAVSMSYTKPATGNVLQDAAGNDADSLTNQAVINGSAADTTAPVLSSATVSGHDLVLTYTEASSLGLDAVHTAPVTAYAVSSASGVAISVESVTVNATAKTVTLRLNRSVDSSEALSLNYTRPATGNDVLQDVAGNDATKLTNQAVTNNSAADTTAPVLSAAVVNGHFLALSYTEASSLGLDETHTAPATAFAVSSASGVAIAVDSVTVNALAKTVTLRLSRDVDSGEAVNVSYTKPASGNNVLQDAAGNDAANLTNEVLRNNSAADTTAPVLGSATVSGRELVLTYTEVSSLGLAATHTAPATAFAVSSASGLAIAIENVTVNATAKTVTLHLSRDVDSTEVLSLNYTRPAAGPDVLQDAAGNGAANLTNQTVSNGSAADTTAPVLGSATVSGHDLVLTYTEASSLGLDAVHTAPATAFAVSSASGLAITVDSVTVNATAKTVTLRLNRSVDSGEAVSLSYTRPAAGPDVLQDAAGNDAANLTNQAVTNNSAADTTAPVLSSTTVIGRDLVLTYTEASSLGLDAAHTAPAAAFAVGSASGVAITVDSLTVDPTAKTVTLHLSRAVDSGEAVTLSYTKPAAGPDVLQDAAGNDADSITSQAATNNSAADTTAPVLGSATVSGRDLVLTYTEASSLGLDAAHAAPATAFAVSSASGLAIGVESVAVDATAKTVTLHLSRDVDSTEAVSLSYTRPASGNDVLQDAAGNDAANLTSQAVTNHSAPDTTAPVFSSATVTGRDVLLSYTEASSLGLDAAHTAPAAAFAVSSSSGLAIAIDSVAVNATAKTVTLRLNRSVDSGETVSVSYTRPAAGPDVLQDAAGNDAGNLAGQAVSNHTAADTTAPALGSATVSGRDLVLNYAEASSLGLDAANTAPATAFAVHSASGLAIGVDSVAVDATAKTVTLRLSRSVDSGEAVTLSYTKPASGNNVLQDATGNDADSFTSQAATNQSAADTTAPVLSSATVSGSDLVLSYTEASSLGLDAAHAAPATAFAVSSASGLAIAVDSVTVDATAKTLTLHLSRSVDGGEAVSVSYTKPASGNDVLQDVAGNDAANLTNQAVTNHSAPDTTAPVLRSTTVSGRDLVLTYTEASSLGLDAIHTAGAAAFAVSSGSGLAIAVDSVTVHATAKTVTLHLSRDVDSGEAVALHYTKPAGDDVLQDAAGNDAANITTQTVTNNTAPDTTAPVLRSAAVNGRNLV